MSQHNANIMYIPPTSERQEQAEQLFEYSKSISDQIAQAIQPNGPMDQERRDLGECCELDHYDFIQKITATAFEISRFRLLRASGYVQAIAEVSLLRQFQTVPDEAHQNFKDIYATVFDMGRYAVRSLGLPEGMPAASTAKNANDIADATLYTALLTPALSTVAPNGEFSFETTALWNLGADMPVEIHAKETDKVLESFTHKRGGILVDGDDYEVVYPEWWAATFMDIASPGKQYNRLLLNRLAELES